MSTYSFYFPPFFLKKAIINKLKTHQLHRKIVKDNKPHSGTHTLETLHPLCVSEHKTIKKHRVCFVHIIAYDILCYDPAEDLA